MDRLQRLSDSVQSRYFGLSRPARAFVTLWFALQVFLFALFWYITPKVIFESLANWANELRDSHSGWILLVGVVTVTSFPPMIGFTTATTITGFSYGLQKGYALALTGTLAGSMGTFLLARFLLGRYAHMMLERQATFKALGHAVKKHGLGLIVLIRLCPFPYSYSNVFFASIKEVSALQFFAATCGLGVKVLLYVYVGTRLYLFSDPEHRDQMDSTTKWLNSISIVVGLVLGAGVGAYVYRLTMGFVSEGEVALIENDADADEIERFLEEEDRLEEEEEGRAAGPVLLTDGLDVDDRETGVKSKPRPSQDNWEGNFSDFGDDADADGPRTSMSVLRT